MGARALMVSSTGLIVAAIALVVGWIEYKVVTTIVTKALRRTDTSKTRAERDEFERRIGLFRGITFVLLVVLTPVFGLWLFS
ncbi:MAG: hypothetical protein DI537_39365 [Stutzerimonas stutzeri]|nr:MAG: hypothetical protein DI537_39365 [Stutzerimonas stutzeri]